MPLRLSPRRRRCGDAPRRRSATTSSSAPPVPARGATASSSRSRMARRVAPTAPASGSACESPTGARRRRRASTPSPTDSAQPRPSHVEELDCLVDEDVRSTSTASACRLNGSSALVTAAAPARGRRRRAPRQRCHDARRRGRRQRGAGRRRLSWPGDEHALRQAIRQGLAALELDAYRDVALVYAPGAGDDVAAVVVDHCERLRFRFAVIDAPRSVSRRLGAAPAQRIADTHARRLLLPMDRRRRPVRPGTGSWCRRADTCSASMPARTPSAASSRRRPTRCCTAPSASSATSANRRSTTSNRRGVNVIRDFPDRGIRVWGARTLSADSQWKYVSVRRLFIFLERSIYEGTQWVVFEPNDERLWGRVDRHHPPLPPRPVALGSAAGRTEEEAFFVTCDRTTMTEDDILNGRLICEIGVAPLRPAELLALRICLAHREDRAVRRSAREASLVRQARLAGRARSATACGGWAAGPARTTRSRCASLDRAVELGCNFFDTRWATATATASGCSASWSRRTPTSGSTPPPRCRPRTGAGRAGAARALDDVFPADHIRAVRRDEPGEPRACERSTSAVPRLGGRLGRRRPLAAGRWTTSSAQGLVGAVGISVNRWEPWNGVRAVQTGADRRRAGDLQHLRPGAGGRAVPRLPRARTSPSSRACRSTKGR